MKVFLLQRRKKTGLTMAHLQNQNADALRGLEENHGIVEVVTLLKTLAKQVTNGKKSCQRCIRSERNTQP